MPILNKAPQDFDIQSQILSNDTGWMVEHQLFWKQE